MRCLKRKLNKIEDQMGRKTEGKAEKTFKRLGKKLDEMISDLQGLKEKARGNFSEQFDELHRNKETLEKEFSHFRENNKDRWDEVESRIEKAGHELKEALKAAFKSKDQ